ncbi:MAG: hypothetical protein AB7Y46_14925 [Armatimonadota bacterium]
MSRVARSARPDLAALAFIAAVALAVTWRTTIGDRALLPTDLYLRMQPWRAHAHEFTAPERVSNPILDAVQQFYPWRLYASRQVRQGIVPLWTPEMLSGSPFVGNNQSAVFYPETWLHYVIRPLKALGWATLAFLMVAGCGMYAFLRSIGLRPLASAIGGVSFMLSGYFVGWLTFPSFRSVPAWLPLMLLGFERSVPRGRAAWLGLTALGTGMQFLAGNLHISIYVLLGFALYVVARLLGLAVDGQRPRRLAAQAGLALAAVVTGSLLAGCQLGPSLEFARLNYRTKGVSYQTQVSHALAPPQLLLGLMPDIFGNPADGNHWGGDLNTWWGRAFRTYTESAWYFGIAPLVLGLAGLTVAPRRQSWFWLGMLLFALALAFGTPLNAILYHLVPGYGQLTGIARAVVLACTAGAVLGALGCEALMAADDHAPAARIVAAICGLLLVIGLSGGAAVWVFTGSLEAAGLAGAGAYTLVQMGRFTLLVIATWALLAWSIGPGARYGWYALVVLVALDMAVFMQRHTPEGRTEYLDLQPDIVAAIRADPGPARIASIGPDFLDRMPPNTHMIFDLQSAQGSESLIYAPYQRLMEAALSERYGFEQIDPAHPVLDLLAVRYLVSTVEVQERGWRLAGRFETRLYENEEAAPRAFLARAIFAHPDADSVLAAITRPDLDPLSAHLHTPGVASGPAPHDGEVRITRYAANSVRVQGEMPPGSWLVLADVAYPGWRAWVDGRAATIVPANLVLRAVHLPRGAHVVQFAYLPASFTLGMFATLLALAGLGGLSIAVIVGGRAQ